MSQSDDTQPNRSRPVLRRVEQVGADAEHLAATGQLWFFCGEYEGTEQKAVDAAVSDGCGSGIYKTFALGSWPGGYLRD